MTEDLYEKLMKQVIADYSSCRGVLVKLRSEKRRTPIILCLSSFRNRGEFVPSQCILWDNEKSIYSGSIKKRRLFNILNKYNICCAEITTAEDSEKGEAPYICFGDRCGCSCERCKCKKEEYYNKVVDKYPFLRGEDEEDCNRYSSLDELFEKIKHTIIGNIKAEARKTLKNNEGSLSV